jgi:hypothetical protein
MSQVAMVGVLVLDKAKHPPEFAFVAGTTRPAIGIQCFSRMAASSSSVEVSTTRAIMCSARLLSSSSACTALAFRPSSVAATSSEHSVSPSTFAGSCQPEPSGKTHCRSAGGLNLAKPTAFGAYAMKNTSCVQHKQRQSEDDWVLGYSARRSGCARGHLWRRKLRPRKIRGGG